MTPPPESPPRPRRFGWLGRLALIPLGAYVGITAPLMLFANTPAYPATPALPAPPPPVRLARSARAHSTRRLRGDHRPADAVREHSGISGDPGIRGLATASVQGRPRRRPE